VFSKAAAGVNYTNPKRAPLLIIAGGADHISPVSLNRKIHKLQGKAPSATELKEYPGRPHFMAGLDGWEEIADEALNWALEHVGSREAVTTTSTT
jgi:alpha-beta hydrolase superfamily lysophospholipase